ncbi:MAG: hypothetical protein QF894_04150 [Alphaproteobacteria bacterium]|nr:hypothetical protein [Alphaproteobacteria bacterium]
MADKGKKDKGKKEQQKTAKLSPKEKRKQKKEEKEQTPGRCAGLSFFTPFEKRGRWIRGTGATAGLREEVSAPPTMAGSEAVYRGRRSGRAGADAPTPSIRQGYPQCFKLRTRCHGH